MSKLIQTWKTCGPALAATTSPTSGASTLSAAAQLAPAAVCTPGWVSKQRTHYLYDDAGRFIGEYDTTTTRWQDTVWFNGQPVAVVQADGVYYVHADHLATPRSVVKASNGVEVWRWDSEPFGATSPTNPNPASGGLVYNVRFPGQYLDLQSGVYYNGMRDYPPRTGRYLQADPIGLAGGMARYSYVGGNPLSYSDPMGLDWFKRADQSDIVGRPGSIVPPGGLVSRLIQDYVPAGYTFGLFHDDAVTRMTQAGWPDFLVNVPTMPYFYFMAVAAEMKMSGEELARETLVLTRRAEGRNPDGTPRSCP